MCQLAVAGLREVDAVRFAQETVLAFKIGAVGAEGAGLAGELREDVDELLTIDIGAFAHELVDHLRIVAGIGAPQDRQADPVERHARPLEHAHQAIHAAGVLGLPFIGTHRYPLAGRGPPAHAIVEPDHDHGDMHGRARQVELDRAQFVLEVALQDPTDLMVLALDL